MNFLTVILFCSLFNSEESKLLEELAMQSKELTVLHSVIDLFRRNEMDKDLPIIIPIGEETYRISSLYGTRKDPITGRKSYHSGTDFACELATTVKATANGTVIYVGKNGGYGKTIILQHKYGYSTLYGHLSGFYVETGQYVNCGKIIGFVGTTGRSTGNHLHYEVRKGKRSLTPLFIKNEKKYIKE